MTRYSSALPIVNLTESQGLLRLGSMEVILSSDLQAKLARIATQRGRNPEVLAVEAIERLVDYDARFIDAVEVGRASARRGDLLEHDAVVERIEQMFRL